MYAFGLPLQFALVRCLPEFSGSAATFGFRLLTLVAMTFGLTWLVDRRLHAWLAERMRGRG